MTMAWTPERHEWARSVLHDHHQQPSRGRNRYIADFLLELTLDAIEELQRELEIAQRERDTAQRRAKGEQRKHAKVRSWAIHETRSARERIGWLDGERRRMQAERDYLKGVLREIAEGGDEIAQSALDEICSGRIADAAFPGEEAG